MLIIVALSVVCTGCDRDDDDDVIVGSVQPLSYNGDEVTAYTWVDNFESPSMLKSNWVLVGNPEPRWEPSANGQLGLFNNNGASPTKNYAVSEFKMEQASSYSVESEVMLTIYNPDGTCVCPGIGIARDDIPVVSGNEIPTYISMRIIYIGNNASWFPAHLRGHTWLLMDYNYSVDDQLVNSSGYIPADLYNENWHRLKFSVNSSGEPTFYFDDKLIWAPSKKIPPLATAKKILLGYTSGGDAENLAGIAYHNWVKATYDVPAKEN